MFCARMLLLPKESVPIVSIDNFSRVGTETTRRRGDSEAASAPNAHLYTFFFNLVHEPFYFPLIGFINIAVGNHQIFQTGFVNRNTANFSGFQAGFVNTIGGNFSGFQSGYINTVGGDFSGFQAGFINTNVGETKGIQAGFVNTSIKEAKGPQFGFINIAVRNIEGIQLGFINYADSIEGIPVGFISIVSKGGYQAIEYSFSELYTYNAAFKIGIEKFYTNIIFAYNQKDEFSLDNFASGIGFGSIFPVIRKFLYINPELNSLSSFTSEDNVISNSFILYAGINLGKLSVAAGPSLTWIYSTGWPNRIPLRNDLQIFKLHSYDADEYNRFLIGARAAARLRF